MQAKREQQLAGKRPGRKNYLARRVRQINTATDAQVLVVDINKPGNL
jgi:hypothetical protein